MKQRQKSIGNAEFNFICALIAMAHRHPDLRGDILLNRLRQLFGSPRIDYVPQDLVARVREAFPEVALSGDFFFPYGMDTMSVKDRSYWYAVKSVVEEAFY